MRHRNGDIDEGPESIDADELEEARKRDNEAAARRAKNGTPNGIY